MRPGIIDGEKLSYRQKEYLMQVFLTPNGVRHFVPADSKILIHGNHFTVDTLDVVRPAQLFRRRSRRQEGWKEWRQNWPGDAQELPVKRRTYRIRHGKTLWEDLEALDYLDAIVAGL